MGPYGRDVEFAIAVLCIAGVCLVCVMVAEFIAERMDGD
jgi:hypothetical protein